MTQQPLWPLLHILILPAPAPQKDDLQRELLLQDLCILGRIGLHVMREVLGCTGKGCLLGRVISHPETPFIYKENSLLILEVLNCFALLIFLRQVFLHSPG